MRNRFRQLKQKRTRSKGDLDDYELAKLSSKLGGGLKATFYRNGASDKDMQSIRKAFGI